MIKYREISFFVVGVIIGIILLIIGIHGFIFGLLEMAQNPSAVEIGRSYDQRPRRAIESVAVDSRGRIHYGLNHDVGQGGSIQVYDNEGVFLYRISFPSRTGVFFFYIGGNDVVRIYPLRHRSILYFYDGELINSVRPSGDAGHIAAINRFRARQEVNEFTDSYGNVYIVRGSSVRMYDIHGNFIRSIRPSSPFLPLQFLPSLAVAIISIVIVVIACKRFYDFRKDES